MQLLSPNFADDGVIPGEFAFCIPDEKTHVTFSQNKNPELIWSDLPSGTRSLVLICHDRDVPTLGDDVNKEGHVVLADLPRTDFFHWVLVDISVDTPYIKAGEFSNGVTPHGKMGPRGPNHTRQGLNDYTAWFAGDPDMAGDYFGYDGPCPPWNDAIVHHYIFTLCALDIERCPVSGVFTGPQVRAAIEKHTLDKATLTGRYSLNPSVKL